MPARNKTVEWAQISKVNINMQIRWGYIYSILNKCKFTRRSFSPSLTLPLSLSLSLSLTLSRYYLYNLYKSLSRFVHIHLLSSASNKQIKQT